MRLKMTTTQPAIEQLSDLNGDGRVSLGELVVSTLTIMALVFLGLMVLPLAVGGVFWRLDLALAFTVRIWFWVSLLVAIVGGVALGIYRLLRYERAENRFKTELQRKWKREDWELAQIDGTLKAEEESRITQAQVDAAAALFLKRYYSGQSISRDAWVRDGLSKDLWDHVNALMKKRKIRRGRKSELEPENFAEAWGLWCEAKLQARKFWRTDVDHLEKQ